MCHRILWSRETWTTHTFYGPCRSSSIICWAAQARVLFFAFSIAATLGRQILKGCGFNEAKICRCSLLALALWYECVEELWVKSLNNLLNYRYAAVQKIAWILGCIPGVICVNLALGMAHPLYCKFSHMGQLAAAGTVNERIRMPYLCDV